MEQAKKDRRVKYTVEKIKKSFFALAKEKNLRSISVKEICERADINRCTFYAHYEDINALMKEMETEFAEQFLTAIQDYKYDRNVGFVYEKFLCAVMNNKELFEFFTSEESTGSGNEIVYTFLHDRTISEWVQHSNLPPEKAEVLFQYYMCGIFAVIKEWCRSDFAIPMSEMMELLENVSKYGTYYYLYKK